MIWRPGTPWPLLPSMPVRALSRRRGLCHAIAHQLGRLFGTPHGNANAMVFPEVLAAYGDCVFSRLAELARLVGVGAADDNDKILANKFVAAIVEMRSTMDMPLQIEKISPHRNKMMWCAQPAPRRGICIPSPIPG